MQNQTQTMILLYLAVLAISISIGILTTRFISTPLLKLSEASLAITHGKIDTRVQIEGTSEIRTLSKSFNTLAEMMANSLLQLEKSNQELELRVQERTHELNASKSSLQRTNFLLSRRESQLRKQQDILFGLTKDKSIDAFIEKDSKGNYPNEYQIYDYDFGNPDISDVVSNLTKKFIDGFN
jgi:nitrate/nitrite-specific signal transduction histidine kinase